MSSEGFKRGILHSDLLPTLKTYVHPSLPTLARFNFFRAYRSRMAASVGLLESWSPWPSRSNTPKPGQTGNGSTPTGSSLQQGSDHNLKSRFRFTPRHYPSDCPPAQVKWYYAVDVGTWILLQTPKRGPNFIPRCRKGNHFPSNSLQKALP